MSPQEQHAIFDRWMTDHPGILHRVAGAFAEGADRNDLLQELMLAVWKAVPAFQGACQPSTFLYRVAHHAALTWKRDASTYRRHVDRLAAQPVAAEDDAGSARDREMLDLIYAEIRLLPPVDRSLLLLHLDGVGYAEISGILGLTESNTGTRLTRLKQRLVSNLKEKTHELR